MPMIEVQNLTKRYRERVAVDSLNFSVAEGEILGFLGPNGAGKSTTIKMLTGILVPTTGTIRVKSSDGKPLRFVSGGDVFIRTHKHLWCIGGKR